MNDIGLALGHSLKALLLLPGA